VLAPELDPDSVLGLPLEPEELPLEPELEPMPGQCLPIGPPFGGVPVFDPGAGALGLGVVGAGAVVDGAVDCAVVVAPVLVEPDDAAPALEMPANAPPVASAPATIVAPSNFDVFMRSNLHLWVEGCCRSNGAPCP
jgi:hypothetical protein